MRHFFIYWLPVLAWCTLLFVQSAFATPDVVPRWPYFDKLMHVGAYALLGFLLYRGLRSTAMCRNRPPWQIIAMATFLATLYGLSDEWHQSFVAERTAEGADLLADCIGGLLGSSIFRWFESMKKMKGER